jgi:signal transduction histidine kinase
MIEEKLAAANEKLRVIGKLTRHDVLNRLQTIKSNVYLLSKQSGKNQEISKIIDRIDSDLTSADRLFEFSRLFEKIGVEEPTKIDVEYFFNEAIALFPDLNIKIFNETKGLIVTADSLLRQVFYNLIENSLKHGQKVTQIKFYFTKQGKQTKLIYEDNGVGIPQASKSRLFTEGFTTRNSTGLGLAMIRKILQVYGWIISEEGEAGKGIRFVISMPEPSFT